MRKIKLSKSQQLAVGLGLFLCVLFAAGRLPLYSGYFIPWYAPDSSRYFDPAYQLATDRWPTFGIRTPGYPLFLFVVLGVFGSIGPVVVLQQLATLVTGLALYVVLARAHLWLAVPAAVAVAGYFTAGDVVLYESYLGPEALYTASLVGVVAAVTNAVVSRSLLSSVLASSLMAMAIYLRPAGMFLIVVFIVLALGLAWAKFPRRTLVGFCLPFPMLLLALAAYNRITIGQFTISPFGSANLIAATATFWEPSDKYPVEMRAAIDEVRASVSPDDRLTLAESWDPGRLYAIYAKYYNPSVHGALARHIPVDPGDARINALFKTVAFDAIRAHPVQYLKFVLTNLYEFFYTAPTAYYWFGSWIEERYEQIYVRPQTAPVPAEPRMRAYILREFNEPASLSTFAVSAGSVPGVTVIPNWALSFHHYLSCELFPQLFNAKVWFWVFVLLLPILAFAAPRARDSPAATAAMLVGATAALMLIGAGLVVSLVEVGIPRYAAPTRFIYFLALPLVVWVSLQRVGTRRRTLRPSIQVAGDAHPPRGRASSNHAWTVNRRELRGP